MTTPTRSLDTLYTLHIHASAVRVNGGALIFLGPSGAGKSTICRLSSGFATPVADDRVFLVPQANEWAVADAGQYPLDKAIRREEPEIPADSVPLWGTFLLHQAVEPRLEKTDALRTCYNLTRSFFEFYWHLDLDVETKERVFFTLADIARLVPGYHLHFDLSSQTIELIRRVATSLNSHHSHHRGTL